MGYIDPAHRRANEDTKDGAWREEPMRRHSGETIGLVVGLGVAAIFLGGCAPGDNGYRNLNPYAGPVGATASEQNAYLAKQAPNKPAGTSTGATDYDKQEDILKSQIVPGHITREQIKAMSKICTEKANAAGAVDAGSLTGNIIGNAMGTNVVTPDIAQAAKAKQITYQDCETYIRGGKDHTAVTTP
jgi:hypothetical protein